MCPFSGIFLAREREEPRLTTALRCWLILPGGPRSWVVFALPLWLFMDLAPLLAPVSGADPCGDNLEYDAEFAELERAAQGKPEQQIGNTIVPAADPEWKLVEARAASLLGRSKDLRVACLWTKARLRTGGLPGFAQGLSLVSELLDRYWDGVHPRLDPDDGNDPTMRMNTLTGLQAPDVLVALRTTPLVSSRTIGRFSLRDIELASGEGTAPADGGEPPSLATIEAAVSEVEVSALAEMANAANLGAESIAKLEGTLSDKVGPEHTPNFDGLRTPLRKIENFLAGGLARRHEAGVPVDGPTNGARTATSTGDVRRGPSLSGEISSREDVIRALDKIIAYYGRHEPSSPVPMFMERCKRLVTMSFLDIVRDLVPDAVSQVELLKGRPSE